MAKANAGLIKPYRLIDYGDPDDAFRPWDARFPAVADRVIEIIRTRAAGMGVDIDVEHIGSSAIPGCAGKGVIDLMVLYRPGDLDRAKGAIDSLGFEPYAAPGAWGEDRPVRVGTIDRDGTMYRLHAHIIAANDPEVVTQRRFRDRLVADPGLVGTYARMKRDILAAGVANGQAYNRRKADFIRSVIGDR